MTFLSRTHYICCFPCFSLLFIIIPFSPFCVYFFSIASICKNLFLCNRQKADVYLLVMLADKPFKTKEITGQLGCSRLSFADENSLLELLNLTPGSATILGLMNDTENKVRLLVDSDLLNEEYFGCHPCINTSSLKIKASDVFDKLTKVLKHEYTVVTLTGE
ncbi:MAG: prolyl-tRNA synthetase associated domain-containing protein [Ruminococcus flavefaciens]|nr:prolyl-tRNA synthetase associated domain-containing protein [Ruminococcus flavefaciens]MCM1062522.1 prolyl-tRNA synthetase associated domain-containing protein [Eubacterium sp.]